MKNFSKLLLAGILLLAPAIAASSAERQVVDVKAGQKTLIYQYGVYLTSCGHAAYPKFQSRGSKHGSVTSAQGSFIMDSGACKGKRLKSTNVYYKPDAGFRGTDKFRVSLGYPLDSDSDWGTKYKVINFTVNVK